MQDLVGPEPAPAFAILREIRTPAFRTPNQTPRAENWFSAKRQFSIPEMLQVRFPAVRAALPGWIRRRSLPRQAAPPAEPGRSLRRKPERGASWRRRIPRCSKEGGRFVLPRRPARFA